jgi:hypothetical protein
VKDLRKEKKCGIGNERRCEKIKKEILERNMRRVRCWRTQEIRGAEKETDGLFECGSVRCEEGGGESNEGCEGYDRNIV